MDSNVRFEVARLGELLPTFGVRAIVFTLVRLGYYDVIKCGYLARSFPESSALALDTTS